MKKLLLFDFDGVIVDTFDMVLSLKNEIGQEISADELRDLFLGNYYERVAETKDEKYREKDNEEWFELYSDKVLEIKPFKDMSEIISDLSKEYTLILVSSNMKSPIQKYLEHYNLDSYFEKIFDAEVHLSKVEKIKMILEEYEAEAKDCLFITDTLGDIKEARAAKVDSIAVTWGFHDESVLLSGRPLAIAKQPEELLEKINEASL